MEYSVAGASRAGASATTASVTRYGAFGTSAVTLSNPATEANVAVIFRGAGTLSKLRVNAVSNGRTTASIVAARKNAADPASGPSVSITGSTSGVFTDLSNSVAYADGDTWNYRFTTGTGVGTVILSSISAQLAINGQNFVQLAHITAVSLSTASTTVFSAWGGDPNAVYTTESTRQVPMPETATFSNMQMIVSANARVNTTTIRFRNNGANGNQTFGIGAGLTGTFEDTTSTDTVSSGNYFAYSVATGTGTQTITTQGNSVKYLGAVPGQAALITGASHGNVTVGSTLFSSWFGAPEWNATEANAQFVMPFAGRISRLTADAIVNTSTAAVTVISRVNGGNGNCLVSITASTTGVFQDLTNGDVVAAADLVGTQASGATVGNLFITVTATVMGAQGAVGASAGVGAATGVGRAVWKTTGAAAGIGAATGVGRAIWKTTGAAAGVATVSGTAKAVWKAVGASAGVAAVTGLSGAIWGVIGSALGLATVTGLSDVGGAVSPPPPPPPPTGGSPWRAGAGRKRRRDEDEEERARKKALADAWRGSLAEALKRQAADEDARLAAAAVVEAAQPDAEQDTKAAPVTARPLEPLMSAIPPEDPGEAERLWQAFLDADDEDVLLLI